MGRRAWIVASSEFVSHRMHLEGVYATASAQSNSVKHERWSRFDVTRLRSSSSGLASISNGSRCPLTPHTARTADGVARPFGSATRRSSYSRSK